MCLFSLMEEFLFTTLRLIENLNSTKFTNENRGEKLADE